MDKMYNKRRVDKKSGRTTRGVDEIRDHSSNTGDELQEVYSFQKVIQIPESFTNFSAKATRRKKTSQNGNDQVDHYPMKLNFEN